MADAEIVDETDLEEFATVAQVYQDCLDQAERRLAGLGFSATTRVKTTTTLLEKLRRESARLSQIHDLAGARLVVEDRIAQDGAVARIKECFAADGQVKVIDRRDRPSYGYRAVHVIVRVEDIPIEIQVRTLLQDAWAQLMERLGDEWGREIRYGGDPEQPDTPLARGAMTRRQAVSHLVDLSEAIARHEEKQAMARVVQEVMAGLSVQLDKAEQETITQGAVSAQIALPSDPEFVRALLGLDDLPGEPLPATMMKAQMITTLRARLKEAEERLASLSKQIDESGAALRGMLEAIAHAASDQEQP